MAYYIRYIKTLIRVKIPEILQELFADTDWGKDLKEEVKQRLNQSVKQTETEERGISAEEVAKKMNLTW